MQGRRCFRYLAPRTLPDGGHCGWRWLSQPSGVRAFCLVPAGRSGRSAWLGPAAGGTRVNHSAYEPEVKMTDLARHKEREGGAVSQHHKK